MVVHAENVQVSPEALAPGTEVGGWRVLEQLGTGGFGTAYRVEALARPGEFFALKMARHLADERVGREIALLMTRAAHPHVVRLHACGRWPHPVTGFLYFVMDWVPGLPFHAWAETHNPSIRLAVEKLATVTVALEHLHVEGVLHRDLKPEHILIRETDGKPLLIDFGVGWYAGANPLTTQGMAPATPHLRSPEAVRFWRKHGGQLGTRYGYKPTEDVYALGVSAYRVLTGHWPFPPHLARDELFAAIESLVPPTVAEVNPRVPRAVSDVIQRMMARRPEDRYASCAQVHAALVAALTFSDAEALEAELFTWEGAPGGQRRVRLPEWPTLPRSMTPPRQELLPRLANVLRRAGGARAARDSVARWTSPGAGMTERSGRGRMRALWVGVVALVGLGGLGALAAWPPQTPPTPWVVEESDSLVGQKMDPEPERPESVLAAAPLLAEPTPAVVAPATNSEDEPSVKTKTQKPDQKKDPKVSEPRREGLRQKLKPDAGTLARVVATCTALSGCASTPEVLPPPPEAECPEGAKAAMKELNLSEIPAVPIEYAGTDYADLPNILTVREQENAVWVFASGLTLHTNAGERSQLLGQTFIRDRIYARFTRILLDDGRHFPICLELKEAASPRVRAGSIPGLPFAEPSSEPGTARADKRYFKVMRTYGAFGRL